MKKLFILLFFVLISIPLYAQHPDKHPQPNTTGNEEPRVSVQLPPEQQSRIGLRVTPVVRKPVEPIIRTVGTLTTDQRKEVHVHTRVNGWIEELFVDYVGKQVKAGQPLFKLYSPDLVSTQNEYLAALRIGAPGREVARVSLERLQYLGVPESEIQEIRRTGKAKRVITFVSPIDGYVTNKTAIRGQYITPEMHLYELADLSKIWVLITLYEFDLNTVKVGDLARATLSYLSNQTFEGKIQYIYPEVDPQTRTAKARIELEAPNSELKPGMFAQVEIKKNLGTALVIPEDSVIDTGVRKVVFVKTSDTQFEPREVQLGSRVSNQFIVQEGLKEGELVVNSANFLLDTESKFRAAIEKGGSVPSGHGGHGK